MYQEALLDSRKFYCATEGFIAQYKVLLHSRIVGPVAKTGEKFLLQQKHRISPLCSVFPWTSTQRAQTGNGKIVFWSPFRRAPDTTSFLEKPRLKVV